MSDSKRCSSADSDNLRENVSKIYSRQGATSKCSVTLALIQFQAMLISHFELHILPKATKTVAILANTHKNVLLVNILSQRSEFADFREINRAKT
jgi:hypothetical protein